MTVRIPSRENDLGELEEHGYHLSKSSRARHLALTKAHEAGLSWLHIERELNALAIRQRGNRLHRGYEKRARADQRWVSSAHLGV